MAKYKIMATLARLVPYCERSEERQATSCSFTHATILSDFNRWSRPLTGSHREGWNNFLSKINWSLRDSNHQDHCNTKTVLPNIFVLIHIKLNSFWAQQNHDLLSSVLVE
jgi:hypothetical protein